MLGNFSRFYCRLLSFFKINFFKKFFQKHYQSVKLYGSRSGPIFCPSWFGSKLFANVINRQLNLYVYGALTLWVLKLSKCNLSINNFLKKADQTVTRGSVFFKKKWNHLVLHMLGLPWVICPCRIGSPSFHLSVPFLRFKINSSDYVETWWIFRLWCRAVHIVSRLMPIAIFDSSFKLLKGNSHKILHISEKTQ